MPWEDPYEGNRPWNWNEIGIHPKDYDIPGLLDLVIHFMQREEWGAQKVALGYSNKHPIKLFVDHFTYTDECHSVKDCMMLVHAMQKKDIADGSRDIKYNFLIGGDGNIYEGRGWHVCASQKLQQFPDLFRRRLDIAYIGDFTGRAIPLKMILKMYEFREQAMWMTKASYIYNYISVRKEDNFDYIVQGEKPTLEDSKAKLEKWKRSKHLPEEKSKMPAKPKKSRKKKKKKVRKEISGSGDKEVEEKRKVIDYDTVIAAGI